MVCSADSPSPPASLVSTLAPLTVHLQITSTGAGHLRDHARGPADQRCLSLRAMHGSHVSMCRAALLSVYDCESPLYYVCICVLPSSKPTSRFWAPTSHQIPTTCTL